MALDPEEFVTLTDHGSMKLRAAVSRAMTLLPKERKRTTIVREGEPAILNFEQIKNLAAEWDERLVPVPLPTSVTIAKRPSCECETGERKPLIWGRLKAEYFYE